ncbi:MAG TPA: polysaccharide biosynthesis tyrosine autokinase [Gemmatimonadales bacterium]|jgi:capsular exopolysaccharide synthesis family protein|nr:polysaccharide biosynthesis tyrosine autokinase [Gemmatimonadales bacterium]
MTTNLAPLPGNLPSNPIAAGIGARADGGVAGASGGPRVSPLLRYFAALRRFKWLILLLTLVGLGGGVLFSRFRPLSYEVNGSILIADHTNNEAAAIQAPSIYLSTQWKQLITQFDIVEPVARARHLYITGPKRRGGPPLPPGPSGPAKELFTNFDLGPRFAAGTYEFKVAGDGLTWTLTNTVTKAADHGAVGDSVGRAFQFLWLPVIDHKWWGQAFTFDVETPREAAEDIISNLKIDMDWRSARFMTLTFTGRDPDGAAETLNDVMKRFVTEAAAMKKHDLIANSAALDSQLTSAQIHLQQDERALEQFKVKTITKPKEALPVAPGLQQTTGTAEGAYFIKQQTLVDKQRDAHALRQALARADSGQLVVDDFTSIPTVKVSVDLMAVIGELSKDEAVVRDLTTHLTDSSIDVIRARQRVSEDQTVRIPRYARVVLERLDDQIGTLQQDITTSESELQQIPMRSIEEDQLERARSTDENIVKILIERYTASRMMEATAAADVSIEDPAVAPTRPSSNRKGVLIAMGVMLGLGTGMGIALLLDITDKRVRYADQITGGLGLTILGVIPEIRRAKGETPTPEEAAQVIEAFRTVRLNLSHTVGDGPIILTISSPSPGDGKSLVSSNLALSFAEAGYKTLLIDGDTRRGELHRTFGVERRPGLLDYLADELPLTDLVRNTSHPQLRIITAGSRKRNAPELLGSARMRELLASMRGPFDVVLVDSPPLGAGIDPFVLGTLTGNLMLVVRAGATERDLAETKLQIVDQLPIRLIGAVLNDVRATMNEYKYYSYSYGYGAVEEGEEQGQLPAVLEG